MKNIKALKKDLEIASEKRKRHSTILQDLGQKLNPLNTQSKYITWPEMWKSFECRIHEKKHSCFCYKQAKCPICYSDTSLYCRDIK